MPPTHLSPVTACTCRALCDHKVAHASRDTEDLREGSVRRVLLPGLQKPHTAPWGERAQGSFSGGRGLGGRGWGAHPPPPFVLNFKRRRRNFWSQRVGAKGTRRILDGPKAWRKIWPNLLGVVCVVGGSRGGRGASLPLSGAELLQRALSERPQPPVPLAQNRGRRGQQMPSVTGHPASAGHGRPQGGHRPPSVQRQPPFCHANPECLGRTRQRAQANGLLQDRPGFGVAGFSTLSPERSHWTRREQESGGGGGTALEEGGSRGLQKGDTTAVTGGWKSG